MSSKIKTSGHKDDLTKSYSELNFLSKMTMLLSHPGGIFKNNSKPHDFITANTGIVLPSVCHIYHCIL